MKTEEDEAFDDLAKRQGAWGGGFPAKRRMAAHKLEGDVDAFERWWYYEGSAPPYTHHDCEEHTKRMCKIAWSNGAYLAAQPAQEPVRAALKLALEALEIMYIHYTQNRHVIEAITAARAALAQPAQEPVECLDCGSHNVGIPATYDSLINSVKALNT